MSSRVWNTFTLTILINVNMAVFWVVARCNLVEVYRRFSGACCPDDGGRKHLCNVGKLLPYYMVQQPRRQPSSYSPSWEPQISGTNVFPCTRIIRSNSIEQRSTSFSAEAPFPPPPHLRATHITLSCYRITHIGVIGQQFFIVTSCSHRSLFWSANLPGKQL
jgi:hypothetical protein